MVAASVTAGTHPFRQPKQLFSICSFDLPLDLCHASLEPLTAVIMMGVTCRVGLLSISCSQLSVTV